MVPQNSDKFFIGSIIIFILVFGLVKVILSTMQDVAKSVVPPDSMAEKDVTERIKPVAQIYIGEAPVLEVAPAEETIAGSGEQVVTQVCALCHSSGMMSSPKLGSASDWAPRIEKGIDTLYENAINGFNMMPARGGSTLSDDEVKSAVDHMLLLAQ